MDDTMTRAQFNGAVLDRVRQEMPETTWRMDGNNSVFTWDGGADTRNCILVYKNQAEDTPVDMILSTVAKNGETEQNNPRQSAVDAVLLTGPVATARTIVKFFRSAPTSENS